MKKKNPVAKFQRQFNQAKVFTDKKKALKSGYQKYRKKPFADQNPQLNTLFLSVAI